MLLNRCPSLLYTARRGLHIRHKSSKPAAQLDLADLPLRLAVIGSGPAGFYAASRILGLKGSRNVQIDMYEELPVPFGLVRYGVAPDHPEVKNCIHKFEETAQDSRFRFFGNVQIGGSTHSTSTPFSPPTLAEGPQPSSSSIPLSLLKPHYHSILLTYGASYDRQLGIPGEDLANVLSARSFVHFYNGHPYASSYPAIQNLDLSKISHVTIVGQGNVAMDCARVLLSPVDDLRATDIPEPVLAELARSQVKRVDVVGRRGPLQLAATTKELREMLTLSGVGFYVDQEQVKAAEDMLASFPDMVSGRMKKRMLGLMKEGAKKAGPAPEKEWSLQYLASPIECLPSPYASIEAPPVKSMNWQVNRLQVDLGTDPGKWKVQGTDATITTETDLVLKSVGYRSIGIEGVPFDSKSGTVPNDAGRVMSADGQQVEGLYVSGWLARGPTGVIATTMMDAYLTAETIIHDFLDNKSREQVLDAMDLDTASQGKKPVTWPDWQKIDRAERENGRKFGKEREKYTTTQAMLDVLQ